MMKYVKETTVDSSIAGHVDFRLEAAFKNLVTAFKNLVFSQRFTLMNSVRMGQFNCQLANTHTVTRIVGRRPWQYRFANIVSF